MQRAGPQKEQSFAKEFLDKGTEWSEAVCKDPTVFVPYYYLLTL
jgi:hypothetical protein